MVHETPVLLIQQLMQILIRDISTEMISNGFDLAQNGLLDIKAFLVRIKRKLWF